MTKNKRNVSRSVRVNEINRKLLERYEKFFAKHEAHKKLRPFASKERSRPRYKTIIAYDLETTSIKAGTPKPVYITAYNEEINFSLSMEVKSIAHLLEILEAHFLTPDKNSCRFVGWNANNFDVYFVSAALLNSPDYILRPYLTKNKKIRGLKVIRKDEGGSWEFLDGMSMTGIQKPLKKFLEIFAPEHKKHDSPDFESTSFDPKNLKHVAYAFRDSEGLYYGINAAEKIVKDNFNIGLQPTIGNLGIKIFQSHIPLGINVWPLCMELRKIIRNYVMRGGYCYCVKKYHGPVWKYDINQAYAAAMRETWLPAGDAVKIKDVHPYAKCAVYLVNARKRNNKVPFYWRDLDSKAQFSHEEMRDCWITSNEYLQLKKEGWQLEVKEGYFWNDQFKMKKYVDRLENLRVNGPGGPKGAQGEMIKAIGNNSYGKTVEQLDGLELVLARECPVGFGQYQDDDELFKHIWFKFGQPGLRDYHQPHIGAFITAHVRMVLRRAILLNPDAWLYADTDGVMFSEPVELDISPTRYGAWKQEAAGEVYRIITKKVYANDDASEKHAKGVNINRLGAEDFIEWFEGRPPVQTQVQRSNYLATMTGEEMFFERTKVGQKT